MTPILSGLVLFAIFLFFVTRGLDQGYRAAAAFLPFGAAAVFIVGGLSILVFSASFLILLGLWGLQSMSVRNAGIRFEFTSLLVVALCIYAVLITMIGPRLFMDEIMVFSMDRNVVGYRLRWDVFSGLSPLVPSTGNISQLAYFLVTFAVFLMSLSLARKTGPELIHKALVGAAIVNIILAVIDIAGGGALLSIVQTATYSYQTDIQLLGVQRVTGGFPEASSFGGFTAVLAGYFIRLWFSTRKTLTGVLGAGNLILGLLSLSSTFILVAVGLTLILCAQFAVYLARGNGVSARSKPFVLFFALSGSAVAFAMVATPAGTIALDFLDYLIFSKTDSVSGFERGKWAIRGLEIGAESYGLGIGLGSTRSNGILSVWISNFGLIGTLLFLWIYKNILFARASAFANPEYKKYFNAAAVGLSAMIIGGLTTATTPDPGLHFALLAALSVASRRPVVVVYSSKQPRLA